MAGGFHSLGLMPEILKAVDELGWNLPTDVQDESIPLILGMLLLLLIILYV
jgi:ATP-dependent RNA helicase DDX1